MTRKILFLLVFLAACAFPQAVRFDGISSTTNSQCAPGAACPLLVIPGTQVNFCSGQGLGTVSTNGNVVTLLSGPSFTGASGKIQIGPNTYQIQTVISTSILTITTSAGVQASAVYSTLAGCLSAPATAYSSADTGMSCPTTAQITPSTGGPCSSTADKQGNYGAWFLPGLYYYYLRTPASAGGVVSGPYPISIGASAGCPSGVTCDANYATLALGCAAAGAGTLYVSMNWNGLTTQTLPCNIYALGDGVIQPGSGQTLTFTGSFDGTANKHLSASTGGSVSMAPQTVFNAIWSGAVGDNSTDNSASLEFAASTGASTVYVPSGTFIAQLISPAANQVWTGPGTLKLKPNATATSAEPMFLIVNSGVKIIGLTFDLNSANVLQNTTANNLVDQPAAASCYSGTLDGVTGFYFDSNTVTDGAFYGVVIAGCSDSKVQDNTFTGLYSGGVVTSYGCRTGCANSGNIATAKVDVSGNTIVNVTEPASVGAGFCINISSPTIGFTVAHNRCQAFADGISNDGTRETIGVQVYGQNAGMSGGLPTFPLHGTIADNVINVPWGLSIAGAQDVAVTGNTIYCSSNANSSNMSFSLTGAGGCILGVEIVASQYVTVKGNNISARSGAPGVGVSVNAACSTCFVNYSDHILIEDNQISGFVAGVNVDTGLAEGGSQLTNCAINSNSAYANANGLIQVKNNEITDYRLFGIMFRSASLAEAIGNRISSSLGNYGMCGTTSGILIGPQLSQLIARANTINAEQISIGDIPTGGSNAGNPTIVYVGGNTLIGGFMGFLNANGAQYHIEANDFQEQPGNQTAVFVVENDPSVPLWGMNNTFEGSPMASTEGTALVSSTSLTIASGAGTADGQYIRGAGIEPGTSIASGGGTTSITLSNATTAALIATPLTFYAPYIVAFSASTAIPAQGAITLCSNNVPAQTALYGGTIANISGCGPAVASGPYSFANIPPNLVLPGQQVTISDSTTNTWGAAITVGGGGDKVLAQWNGTNWTVMGK